MRQPEDLFADDLGHEERLRLVGEIVGRKVRRPFWHGSDDEFHEPIAVGAVFCRDRDDLGEATAPSVRLDLRQQSGLGPNQVDLIETAVHWRADRANALEESFVESIWWLSRIRHDTHQVDIFECAVYGLDHESAERSGSRVNAGRICEHDLRLWQLLDAGDARPRRLRTRRYN